jgi:hypothetical protein
VDAMLKKVAKGLAIAALAFVAFVALITTMSERLDTCRCGDGVELSEWSTGWTRASRHCTALCAAHGGGQSLRPD